MRYFILLTCVISHISFGQSVNYEWVGRSGGSNYEVPLAVVSDANGNVYSTGWFTGTADFDPGAGTLDLTAASGHDLFVQKLDANGNLLWVSHFEGNYFGDGYDITLDPSGNVLLTGFFIDTLDIDLGTGVNNLISNGWDDIFVIKMDASGNVLWGKNFGSDQGGIGQEITTDALGNIYTTGYFSDTADFDPGPGVYELISSGGSDIFIQKMDTDGNFVWARQMGNPGGPFEPDHGWGIAVDSNGDVITYGEFSGISDFDPDAIGVLTLASNGGTDLFIHKMDSDGNFIWAKSIGGTDDEQSRAMTVDSQNNILFTGFFKNTVDFDPAAGTNEFTATGLWDGFVVKLNASGDLVWAKQFEGDGVETTTGIAVDGHDRVYVSGYYSNTIDIDPGAASNILTSGGSDKAFIVELAQNGDFVWGLDFGGSGNTYTEDMDVQDNGFIYTCGFFDGLTDFNFGTGMDELTSEGGYDIFIHKLSRDVTGVSEVSQQPKELIKIVDLLGRETKESNNEVLIYMYSDGTSEKVIRIE